MVNDLYREKGLTVGKKNIRITDIEGNSNKSKQLSVRRLQAKHVSGYRKLNTITH